MKMIDEIISKLDLAPTDLEYFSNCDLTRYSTMELKAQGDLIVVKSKNALIKLVQAFYKEGVKYRLLGLGANQILPEQAPYPYIKLNLPFDAGILDQLRDSYTLPASVTLGSLTRTAMNFGLKGWEVWTGVPATLGGAIVMNAGTNLGDIGPCVKSLEIITREGNAKTIHPQEGGFTYRQNNILEDGDIVFSVELIHLGTSEEIKAKIKDYLKMRKTTQPLQSKSCGCVFKNYSKDLRAGQCIDQLGLKGLSHKGLRISTVHANFIENVSNGQATASDLKEFIEIIKQKLKEKYGVDFEAEVKF